MRLTLAVVAALFASNAHAQCYKPSHYTPSYSYQQSYQQSYYTPSYYPSFSATTYYAVPYVNYSQFGVGYNSGAFDYQTNLLQTQLEVSKAQTKIAELTVEVLKSRVHDVKPVVQPHQTPAPQPVMPPIGATPVSGDAKKSAVFIVQQRCAKCHSDGSNKGGIVLLRNNDFVHLTSDQKMQVMRALGKQSMPPAAEGPKLTDNEGGAVVQALLGL